MINPGLEWPFYETAKGVCINAECEKVIQDFLVPNYGGKVQLVFTSPPFPLNRAKKYGNLNGEEYKNWICGVGNSIKPLLTSTGSIVIEIGNAWNAGQPTFSTLPIETLLEFKEKCGLYLCQEFIYYNPARLPSPIEWVNKRRVRVKDSFTRLWWMSTTPNPLANNRNVLEDYSKQMNKLLATGKYNYGARPSEHKISENAFSKNNGGAIPSNVIIASNTESKSKYLKMCKENRLPIHPARMPYQVPEFFIKLLTDENDIVFDCFSGSNTTGFCAEKLGRQWISIEANDDYFKGSKYRFEG